MKTYKYLVSENDLGYIRERNVFFEDYEDAKEYALSIKNDDNDVVMFEGEYIVDGPRVSLATKEVCLDLNETEWDYDDD